MVRSARDGDFARARIFHDALADLFRDLCIESNPAPVKHLLAQRGTIAAGELRLPLVPLTPEHAATLEKTFADFCRMSEGLPVGP